MAIIVPANIFELSPDINILDFPGLGAQFKSFKNRDEFSISITFEVFSNAYYNDEPLIINNKKLDINNFSLSNYNIEGVETLKDLVNLDGIKNAISPEKIQKTQEDIQNALSGAWDNVSDPSKLPECPEPTKEELEKISAENTMTATIKNKDGDIIAEVTKDLSQDTKICPNDAGIQEKIKANFLSALPKINPGNNIKPSDTNPLCKLEDNSEIKKMVQKKLANTDITKKSLTDYNTSVVDNLTTEVNKQLDLINGDNAPKPEDIQKKVDDIVIEKLPQYGIPLLQINLDFNIIIQIVDGKLKVLNFENYISGQEQTDENKFFTTPEFTKKKLEIDYEILQDNDAKIIPGIIYTMVYTRKFNFHTIELKKFYDDKIFSDTENSSVNTGLYYLGVDKKGLKQFCGKFYEVKLQKDKINITNPGYNQTLFPDLYGALAYYDFYNKDNNNTRIKYNRVYPYKSLGKPLSLRGKYWYLEPRLSGNYTFPNHTIIDDMFCKNKFTNKSFTIILFIKRNSFMDYTKRSEEFSIKKQVILSDPINNNSFEYDEQEMELTFNFHGYKLKQYVNLVPDKWYQLNIRYNYDTQEIYLDTYYKDLNKSFLSTKSTNVISDYLKMDDSPEVAQKKHFILNSINAEYSFSSKGYIYQFDTLNGPIALFDKFIDREKCIGIFESFFPVLYYYKNVGSSHTPNGIIQDY